MVGFFLPFLPYLLLSLLLLPLLFLLLLSLPIVSKFSLNKEAFEEFQPTVTNVCQIRPFIPAQRPVIWKSNLSEARQPGSH